MRYFTDDQKLGLAGMPRGLSLWPKSTAGLAALDGTGGGGFLPPEGGDGVNDASAGMAMCGADTDVLDSGDGAADDVTDSAVDDAARVITGQAGPDGTMDDVDLPPEPGDGVGTP